MVVTYTGTLREQGRIEWDGPIPVEEGVRVTLTVTEPLQHVDEEYERLFEKLQASGRGIETVIPDPVAWQKEMRSNRSPHDEVTDATR